MTKKILSQLKTLLAHDNKDIVTAVKESIRSLYEVHVKMDKRRKKKKKPTRKTSRKGTS